MGKKSKHSDKEATRKIKSVKKISKFGKMANSYANKIKMTVDCWED